MCAGTRHWCRGPSHRERMTCSDHPLHIVGIPRDHAPQPGVAVPGSDLAGRILNERNAARAASTYQATPVFEPASIPRGQTWHVGGGVFLSRCPDCDDYVRCHGSVQFLPDFADHQFRAHGIRQQALLP